MTKRERVIRRAVATLELVDRETAKAVAADLRTLLPKRVLRPVPQHREERAERKATRRDADARIRAIVFARDRYRCRHCASGYAIQLDHFLGRARDRRANACWTLCERCHAAKTDNKPSRRYWLERFREHVTAIDAGVAVKVNALLALDAGKHPSGAPSLESAK